MSADHSTSPRNRPDGSSYPWGKLHCGGDDCEHDPYDEGRCDCGCSDRCGPWNDWLDGRPVDDVSPPPTGAAPSPQPTDAEKLLADASALADKPRPPKPYVTPTLRQLAEDDPRVLKARIEQLQVQLAGCGVAAKGGIDPRTDEAKPGDFGWTPSYGDVVELRHAYEALDRAIGTVRPALKWIVRHAPSPDPHALVGHASTALAAIEEARKGRQHRPVEPTPQGQKLPSATPLDLAEMREMGRVGRAPLEQRVLQLCDEIDRLVEDIRKLRGQLAAEVNDPEGTAPGGPLVPAQSVRVGLTAEGVRMRCTCPAWVPDPNCPVHHANRGC